MTNPSNEVAVTEADDTTLNVVVKAAELASDVVTENKELVDEILVSETFVHIGDGLADICEKKRRLSAKEDAIGHEYRGLIRLHVPKAGVLLWGKCSGQDRVKIMQNANCYVFGCVNTALVDRAVKQATKKTEAEIRRSANRTLNTWAEILYKEYRVNDLKAEKAEEFTNAQVEQTQLMVTAMAELSKARSKAKKAEAQKKYDDAMAEYSSLEKEKQEIEVTYEDVLESDFDVEELEQAMVACYYKILRLQGNAAEISDLSTSLFDDARASLEKNGFNPDKDV